MRLIKPRCIIQNKDASDKYYPKVLSIHTTTTFPWSVPLAEVRIHSNTDASTAGYMSPIRNDDIIRLQVDVRSSDTEKSVWQDIFEGRIMESESEFGSNNVTTLICRGHGEEVVYRPVTADYSASGARTGTILSSLVNSYLSRLTDTTLIDTSASTVIPKFNVQQDTKYLVDVINKLESLEAHGYLFKVITNYDSNGDLDTNIISWHPVPSISKTIKIIEGTPRPLYAKFSKSIENVVEDATIYGASGTPQKVGTSIDSTPSYGTRFHIGVDTTITEDDLCESLAVATRSWFGSGLEKGSVVILGDPNINVGDLIHVKFPSLVIDGSSIDGDYRVKRLSDTIVTDKWTIAVELGELIETPADIIAGQHTANRLLNANFID